MIEYTGYIKKIRFYSESSNYIVALIEVEQEDKLITMNGYMNNFNDYENMLLLVITKFILNMVNSLNYQNIVSFMQKKVKKLLNIYLVRYLRGLVKLWQHK